MLATELPAFLGSVQGDCVRHPDTLDELSVVGDGNLLGALRHVGHRPVGVTFDDIFFHAFDGFPGLAAHAQAIEHVIGRHHYHKLTVADFRANHGLLSRDGVIVVSIDDNEVFRLGMLLDKVFGEEKHVATCVWQKRYSRENREAIGDAHEYLLIYSANPMQFKKQRGLLPLTDKQLALYKNPDNDKDGPWQSVSLTAQGYRPNQMYEITAPNGSIHRPPEGTCWKLIESEYQKLVDKGLIYFGKDGNGVPRRKYHLKNAEGIVPWTWWPHEEAGHTDEAKKEIQDIFGTQTAFDTPKPVRLIERVLQIVTKPGDIVLDFFAGSGTTAHATIRMKDRSFILVSSTEATVDYPNKNICRDVCAERVRRVITGYSNKKGEQIAGLDGDFAYFRAHRIPMERLHASVGHDQVWTALQQLHAGLFNPFDANADLHLLDVTDTDLYYVAKVTPDVIATLTQRAKHRKPAVIYSWQPGVLQQRVKAEHFAFEKIPNFLVDRFGGQS